MGIFKRKAQASERETVILTAEEQRDLEFQKKRQEAYDLAKGESARRRQRRLRAKLRR